MMDDKLLDTIMPTTHQTFVYQ